MTPIPYWWRQEDDLPVIIHNLNTPASLLARRCAPPRGAACLGYGHWF